MRDHSAPGDRDFEADLESGGSYNDEESNKDPESQAAMLFAKVCGGNGVSVCSTTENAKTMNTTDMKVEGSENMHSAEKKTGKEKRKKTSNKKPPKPPRPPRGPSLDAADQKLIKEITELAMMKRAKIDRMKALKKMKAVKSTSPSSNLLAMVFTVLFCLVILFQGLSSRTSQPAGSEPGGMEGGLISVQYYGNPSPNDLHGPASGSPDSEERVTGPNPQVRPRKFNR